VSACKRAEPGREREEAGGAEAGGGVAVETAAEREDSTGREKKPSAEKERVG